MSISLAFQSLVGVRQVRASQVRAPFTVQRFSFHTSPPKMISPVSCPEWVWESSRKPFLVFSKVEFLWISDFFLIWGITDLFYFQFLSYSELSKIKHIPKSWGPEKLLIANLIGLGVSICLDRVSIETLDTGRELVSTVEIFSTVWKTDLVQKTFKKRSLDMAYALKSRFLSRSQSRLLISTLLKVDLDHRDKSRHFQKSISISISIGLDCRDHQP